MTSLGSSLVIPGLLFLLTLASGVWLSRSGKPLNAFILTIHKLIALASVILTGLAIYNLLRAAHGTGLGVALVVVTAVCALDLFVSGALLSLGRPVSKIFLTIHQITPMLAVLSAAGAIYLLAGI